MASQMIESDNDYSDNDDGVFHVLQSNEIKQSPDEDRLIFGLYDKLTNIAKFELRKECGKNIHIGNIHSVRRDDPDWYWFEVEGIDRVRISILIKIMNAHFGPVGVNWDLWSDRGFIPTDYKDVIKLNKKPFHKQKTTLIDKLFYTLTILGILFLSYIIDWNLLLHLYNVIFASFSRIWQQYR